MVIIMGVDIHMSIIKDKEYVAKDIYNGRNSEWFNNLQERGDAYEYDFLPIAYYNCFPKEDTPEDLNIEKLQEDGYYGFRTIKVDDYVNWFEKYRPDKDAGWVTTYDKWRIENKGYVPEEVSHYLDPDDNPADMHFVVIEKKYDNAKWLYNYIMNKEINFDAYIIYYFDC